MKQLLIIGVGGFAREVYELAQNSLGYQTDWIIKGFIDGTVKLPKEKYDLLEAPVWDNVEKYEIAEEDVFVCAVADPEIKMHLCQIIENRGGDFINLIHTTATVSPRAIMGRGIILGRLTGISCDVRIGNHVLLNTCSAVGHDASIGSFTSIMSYVDITGNAEIGERTYWGSGARCLPHSKIEHDSVVGAGSVVLKKVKAHQTVFGVPAKSFM